MPKLRNSDSVQCGGPATRAVERCYGNSFPYVNGHACHVRGCVLLGAAGGASVAREDCGCRAGVAGKLACHHGRP